MLYYCGRSRNKINTNRTKEFFGLNPLEKLLSYTINKMNQLLELNLLQTEMNNYQNVGTKRMIIIEFMSYYKKLETLGNTRRT